MDRAQYKLIARNFNSFLRNLPPFNKASHREAFLFGARLRDYSMTPDTRRRGVRT